jgi:hypothetical protein
MREVIPYHTDPAVEFINSTIGFDTLMVLGHTCSANELRGTGVSFFGIYSERHVVLRNYWIWA